MAFHRQNRLVWQFAGFPQGHESRFWVSPRSGMAARLAFLAGLRVLSHPVIHDANAAAEFAVTLAEAQRRNNLLARAAGRIAGRVAPPRAFPLGRTGIERKVAVGQRPAIGTQPFRWHTLGNRRGWAGVQAVEHTIVVLTWNGIVAETPRWYFWNPSPREPNAFVYGFV